MKRTTLLLSSALALLPFAPAFAQDVTIVLGEDIDLMEPCMATRSNIGRIIMQNVNETLTTYDVRNGKGRPAPPGGVVGAGQRHLALPPAPGRDLFGRDDVRRERREGSRSSGR